MMVKQTDFEIPVPDNRALQFILDLASPNPNSGTFVIHLTGQSSVVHIQVHNASGTLLYETDHIAAQTINLPVSLIVKHPGMYIVSVTDAFSTRSSKIVVE